MKDNYHIADLIARKIKGVLGPKEKEELDKWIHESPGNQEVYTRATDPRKQLDRLEIYALFNKEKAWTELENKLFETKIVRFTPQKILRYAAAIVLPLLVAGGFAYKYLIRSDPQSIAEIDTIFQPGTQKAVLILADGGSVELEEGMTLDELQQGNVKISIRNSFLNYTSTDRDSREPEVIYNELRTPHGGGYNLRLADGTGVWLNAGSSIKFPVSFTEESRQVYLEGEAYFEVRPNGKPFVVSSEAMDVRVLGTTFNISAYGDETLFKTTLVEGKVSVELKDQGDSPTKSLILAPDHQAIFNRSEKALSDIEVNATQYTSWMRGKLEFHNESLDQVMKRLARWYDFEYEFENQEAQDFHFSARLNNGENISAILEMLEMTTDVKFELREQKIVVL
jgi:ferric-dicitrate binding protein FerR (iron transport regulator)